MTAAEYRAAWDAKCAAEKAWDESRTSTTSPQAVAMLAAIEAWREAFAATDHETRVAAFAG